MPTLEAQIEHDLIDKLVDLKYRYRPDIRDRASLEANFREKFEALNRVKLIDAEFQRLLDTVITPDVFAASQTLRNLGSFEREDGTPLNYSLVNLKDWCKNDFEVVNQLRMNTDNSHHRYDVILLINGVPVVQIELKGLKVSPRRAMQQIVDYKSDPGNGYTKTLLCFVQLFIVSNRNETHYFANNNARHFNFHADERFLPVYQFASEDNKKVSQLDDFADQFLPKCTLGQMVSRYMVMVASEQKLLMMRPYQIYAVKAIVECIHQNSGNGYVWHTTGSGKTLTSFKASTLLKDNPDIDKCLFVVDRKDLDRQTREEFNRFQEGCVEENTNTETLVRRLLSDNKADKVIVTTIQKLGLALDATSPRNYKARLESLRQQRLVFIFDECHRSQFGDNHQAIKDFFPRAQLFGFTGTPIFDQNATQKQATQTGTDQDQVVMRTTDDLFQRCLHQYTITHAIEDQNVLKFHVDYFKPEGKNPPPPGEPLAKAKVVERMVEKHDASTNQRKFNALLATASINDAIEYFDLLRTTNLNVACVFSPPAEGNQDVQQIQEDLPQERQDNQVDPVGKKAALARIVADYNARFGTNHRVADFDLYYQDVQKRIKDHQYPNADLKAEHKIDVTIVVDMLLTGFDSKYLNTLYVDKNLKYHGLIQAFSRTNRVLNDTKPYGNILDFRQQEGAVNAAIALFSGEKTEGAREIWLVDAAPVVIQKYEAAVAAMEKFLVDRDLLASPDQVWNLQGDAARIEFVTKFKEVQRLKTQLDQYTDLTPQQQGRIEAILSTDQLQGFRSTYLETAKRLREEQGEKEAPPEVDQLDFEFVLFASAVIDYDYIVGLIARMTHEKPGRETMSRSQLIALIQGDAKFLDERDDIAEYIRGLPVGQGLDEAAVKRGYQDFKAEKKTRELHRVAAHHGLDPGVLGAFVDDVLRRRVFDGQALGDLLAPLNLGWKARTQKELALVDDLTPLFHKVAQGRTISGLEAYEQR